MTTTHRIGGALLGVAGLAFVATGCESTSVHHHYYYGDPNAEAAVEPDEVPAPVQFDNAVPLTVEGEAPEEPVAPEEPAAPPATDEPEVADEPSPERPILAEREPEDVPDDAPDTGEPAKGPPSAANDVPLPSEEWCEVPADLPADPIVELSMLDVASEEAFEGTRVHLTDLDHDAASGLLFGAGFGGLYVFGVDAGEPSLVGHVLHPGIVNADEVAVMANGRVAVSDRKIGVQLYNCIDPTACAKWGEMAVPGASGMHYVDDHLYVLSLEGHLHVYDWQALSAAPMDPAYTMHGLGIPWDLATSGDWAYVVDDAIGLAVLDISDPGTPTLVHTVPMGSSAKAVTLDGDHLYVAAGAAGVEIFDVSDPGQPVSLGVHALGDSVVGVDVADGWLWATDMTGIVVADVSDPSAPVVVATEETAQFAFDVWASEGGHAIVADWERIGAFAFDAAAQAPDLQLDKDTFFVPPTQHAVTIELTNKGNAPLELAEAFTSDPRVAVELPEAGLAPGASISLTIDLGDAELPADFGYDVCVVTNDPDQPLTTVSIQAAKDGVEGALGAAAPDFVAEDLDGELHALAELAGKPVLLVFFATWCPVCAYETSDIDKAIYQAYQDQGVEVFGVASQDTKADVLKFVKQVGLSYPILFDPTETLSQAYFTETEGAFAIYPQQWLIGVDGTIQYVATSFDATALVSAVEAEIDKM